MPIFVAHHVRDEPDGPRVVLLHGVFTDHHLWDPVVRLLDGVDVVALDSPGHGAAPRSTPLPPLDDQAEALGERLAELAGASPGGRPVVLAGHSWGGMLLLRLAARRPDLVPRLLLTNTPLMGNRGRARAGFLAQRAAVRAGLPPGLYGRVAATSLYGARHRKLHADVLAATAATVSGLGRRGLIEIIDRVLVEPDDTVELLPRVGPSLVLVAGTEDYVGSPAVRDAVERAGRRLHQHPGGHMGPAEAPDDIARLLRTLLSGTMPALRQ